MKNPILLACMIALSSFSFILMSCGDENSSEDTNQNLHGTWNVTSWTHGGDEQLGTILASSYTMEFDSISGTSGFTDWTITTGVGFVNHISGDYEVKDDGKILEFQGQDWDLEVDGDELRVEGVILSESYVLVAEKQ